MPAQAVERKAGWYDAFTVGGVKLHVSRAGAVLTWRLSGNPLSLTKSQEAELVALFWRRVWMGRGPLEAAWNFLIPKSRTFNGPLSGGIGWAGPLTGVVYVDRHK